MSKYSAAQVAKFHQFRQQLIKVGASPYLATGAAYFEASDNADLKYNLRLRKDATGMIDDEWWMCRCEGECCIPCERKTIKLKLNNKDRSYFRLVTSRGEWD